MRTEVGNIAGMLDNQADMDTPLKRKLNAVGKTLTVVGLLVCALIFAIGALYRRPLVPQVLVAADGEEKCINPQAARCGNAGQCDGNLFR